MAKVIVMPKLGYTQDEGSIAEWHKKVGDSAKKGEPFFDVHTDKNEYLYELLRCEELCVLHLAQRLDMGQSAISHQLRILRAAGLVRPRRDGKTVYYALDDDHVRSIIEAGMTHIMHK